MRVLVKIWRYFEVLLEVLDLEERIIEKITNFEKTNQEFC